MRLCDEQQYLCTARQCQRAGSHRDAALCLRFALFVNNPIKHIEKTTNRIDLRHGIIDNF